MFWDNPVPVVAAIVERDTGEVVLARNVGWPEGRFGLVTGFLEPAETPEQGVLREVAEEINLPGEIRGFVGLYPFYRNNQLLLVYHVAVSGEPRPGEELAEIRSIPPERLRTCLSVPAPPCGTGCWPGVTSHGPRSEVGLFPVNGLWPPGDNLAGSGVHCREFP